MCTLLKNRLDISFISLKAKQILSNAREKEGFGNEVDHFVKEAISLYDECVFKCMII